MNTAVFGYGGGARSCSRRTCWGSFGNTLLRKALLAHESYCNQQAEEETGSQITSSTPRCLKTMSLDDKEVQQERYSFLRQSLTYECQLYKLTAMEGIGPYIRRRRDEL